MSGTDGVVQKKPAVIPGEPPPLNVAGDAGDDTRHDKTKAIDDALKDHVENEGPVIKQSMEFLRLRTKKFMATSIMGTAWDVSFLVLSCISGFAFIRSTYLPPRPSEVDDKNLKNQLEVFELISSALFGFDWGLNYFMADDKNEFVGSFFSMVDLLSVIPTYILYGASNEAPYSTDIHTLSNFLWYLLNAATCARILRVLRIRKYLLLVSDEVQQKIGEIILMSLVTLVFFAALMQFFERVKPADMSQRDSIDFNVWLYVMLVTTSTVGFGEITPETELGKVSVMFMILFVVMGLPVMTNELFEKMRYSSFWARLSYNKISNSSHVVVCGDMRSVSLSEFFSELFHEDHHNENLHAVILANEQPWREMMSILRNPKYTLNVTFLEGSALNDHDLRRAHVTTATAIFIMTDKFTADPDQEDARAILQQFSIKRFIAANATQLETRPEFRMQLIRVENLRHLDTEQDDDTSANDVVVCLNEIKMGIMATNILYPGTSIMLFNLLMSFADDGGDDDEDDDVVNEHGVEELDEEEAEDWLDEYINGCDWEIYTTEISPDFCTARFSTLAYLLYARLSITLFGLQLTDIKGVKHVLLNPENFDIPREGEYAKVEGFVIAKNQSAADLSTVGVDMGADSFTFPGKEQTRLATLAVICQSLSLDQGASQRSRRAGANNSLLAPSRQSVHGSLPGGIGGGMAGNRVRLASAEELELGQSKAPAFRRARVRSNGNQDESLDSDFDEEDEMFLDDAEPKKPVQSWLDLRKQVRKHDVATEQQEKLLKLEDTYMQDNYYCRAEMVQLSQVTINTSLAEDFPMVTDHLIIIAKALSNLHDLIAPLRAKRNQRLITIVIMSPSPLSKRVWQRISQFEGILFLRGSPLQESDLLRAGVFHAKHVVLLADIGGVANVKQSRGDDEMEGNEVSEVEADVTVDADAIFTYQSVRRLNEDADITVEIVRDNNIRFLDPSEAMVHFKASPQFAAGNIFISSLLDTLSVQSFYNPDIINIVNHLVTGSDTKLNTVRDYEEAAEVAEAEQQGIRLNLPSSRLYQIPIPDGLTSMTYGAMFKTLVKRRQMPLGIIRGVFESRQFGSRGNKLRYCYTNPPKDAEIFSCDSVIVLSPKPPKSTPAAEKSLARDIERARNAVKKDNVNLVNFMNKEMGIFAEMQADMHKKVNQALRSIEPHDKTRRASEIRRSSMASTIDPNSSLTEARRRSSSPSKGQGKDGGAARSDSSVSSPSKERRQSPTREDRGSVNKRPFE